MTKPLISIIIPVYNSAKFIRKCLDSILAQTYTNWEAILVNDGSTDNCGVICDEYAKKNNRFKVLHQENKGVVSARNRAIATATGDFLAFVDSDDFISSIMLEKMVTLAVEEESDIVWCNVKKIHKDFEEVEQIRIHKDNDTNIRKLLECAIPGYLPNKLISKDFWDNANIETDKQGVMWEDTYISLQLLMNNPKNAHIDSSFYSYNQTNENSATAQNEAIIIKAEKNIINIYKYLVKYKILKKYFNEFSKLALKLKIAFLSKDIDKAYTLFPFAHKRYTNYNLSHIANLFYYIAFNSGWLGKQIFKFHFWK